MNDRLTIRRVGFELHPWEGGPARELLPTVDGIALTDLVETYERAHRFDVIGGYAGLVLEHLSHGSLPEYLSGRDGSVALLGCNCGEVGCWPLEAQVVVGTQVTWRGFRQPHRPRRDYSSFGPFTFDRSQYDAAVRRAAPS
ncbi:hypothetical protein [Kribbella kalugense]|uniref:Uncharacterized protein n=1 Tax=Kribbella kalugense TaxID=2512221 RepID=A0A4R8A3M3_9ACTN|nr:hypothetical protein [Kribbella kalugense]TDW24038.1 hypothetical protein EV650_2901 [Kribbella kalugense]